MVTTETTANAAAEPWARPTTITAELGLLMTGSTTGRAA